VVKEAGGCVIQAHPLRQRYYIDRVILSTGCVDAIEVANGGNDREHDALAYRYAKKTGKPIIAGSDIHDVSDIYSENLFGTFFNRKLNNIGDFCKAICDNEIAGLKTDHSRFDFYGNEKITLPVEIRDKNDQIISRNRKDCV
jgi:hypothetical protein